STAATLLLAVVGFMILYRVSRPMNALRWTVFLGVIAGMLLCICFIPGLFAITSVSLKCGMLLGVFALATEPVLRYTCRFVEWVETTFSNMRKQHRKKKTRPARRKIRRIEEEAVVNRRPLTPPCVPCGTRRFQSLTCSDSYVVAIS